MENQDGKRVARGPGMPRGGKIALAVVLVLVLALAGGYVGLCAYAGSSAFLPNTSIAGVDVSGQSREGAAAALEGALPGLLADSRAEFTCAGQSSTLIQAGSSELLLSDSIRLRDRLVQAAVPCRLEVWTDLWHVFQMFPMKKATEAMESIGRFLLETL